MKGFQILVSAGWSFRSAQLIGLMHDKQRERRSYHVANNGKEPDQPIKAEAYAGAGPARCRPVGVALIPVVLVSLG